MKSLEISGKIRQTTGKKNSKNLRKQDFVPCVLYGQGENVHFITPFSEFRALVYTPDVFVAHLNIEGNKYTAILQETQWHPVEEKLLHADFLQIDENKKVKIDLPLTITGSAKGIKAGGKLKVNMRKIKVKGLVKDLPDTITVDITNLDLEQNIKVGDLHFDGVEFLANKSNVLAAISVTRASKSAAAVKETSK